MVKRLAHKVDKRLLTDVQIKELKLDKSSFTTSWQGRLFIKDVALSEVAQKLDIKEKGEYAIKVR